jgi:hypothetical protein
MNLFSIECTKTKEGRLYWTVTQTMPRTGKVRDVQTYTRLSDAILLANRLNYPPRPEPEPEPEYERDYENEEDCCDDED